MNPASSHSGRDSARTGNKSVTASVSAACGLLALPRELRDQIRKGLFNDERHETEKGSPPVQMPGILSTCRQLRGEALPILWESFELKINYPSHVPARDWTTRCVEKIDETQFASLQRLTVSYRDLFTATIQLAKRPDAAVEEDKMAQCCQCCRRFHTCRAIASNFYILVTSSCRDDQLDIDDAFCTDVAEKICNHMKKQFRGATEDQDEVAVFKNDHETPKTTSEAVAQDSVKARHTPEPSFTRSRAHEMIKYVGDLGRDRWCNYLAYH